MRKEGNKAVIGAFVVGALVLAVAGIVTFGSGMLFSAKETFVMYFDGDLKGLNIGAPVAFRGVRVGEVTDITVFIESDTLKFHVPVMVEIDPRRFHHTEGAGRLQKGEADLKTLIQKGMRAQLSLQSIVTGQLMIQLDFYPDTPVSLKGDGKIPEIPTIPSSFQRLAQAIEKISFRELVDNINQAVQQVGSILDKNEFEKVLDSIRTAADAVGDLARHLDEQSAPLLDSLQRASHSADRLIQNTDRQIAPVLSDAQAALESIRQAMVKADQTLQTIDLLAEGYTERSAFHYEVSNALKEVAAAARSLRALTDLLQQQPEALIRGRGEPGGQ
jgi:paraquat-inducible protein B